MAQSCSPQSRTGHRKAYEAFVAPARAARPERQRDRRSTTGVGGVRGREGTVHIVSINNPNDPVLGMSVPVFPADVNWSAFRHAGEFPGVTRELPSGPGLRGLSNRQVVDGIDRETFDTVLNIYGADRGFTVTAVHVVHVDGSVALEHTTRRLLDAEAWRPVALPTFTTEELRVHGWSEQPETTNGRDTADADGYDRWLGTQREAYARIVQANPDRLDTFAAAVGLPASAPAHWVAWCRLSADGHDYLELLCECSSRYRVEGNETVVSWLTPPCPYIPVAADTRIHQVRHELGITFGQVPDPALVRELLDRALAGEWVGQSSGSAFWGSNLYLQTVEKLTGVTMRHLWPVADAAVRAGLFGITGAVLVNTPVEPDEPSLLVRTVPLADGVLEVYGPAGALEHSRWHAVFVTPSGDRITVGSEPLMYESMFGFDRADLDRLDTLVTGWTTHASQSSD